MSPSETREFWAEVIQLQKESGQTIASFLKSEGLPEHRYYYWRKRLEETDSVPSEPSFVPVSFTNDRSSSKVVVRVGGFMIEVTNGFDPVTLGKVLETAAGVKC